jgi:hypothetical protein
MKISVAVLELLQVDRHAKVTSEVCKSPSPSPPLPLLLLAAAKDINK